MKKYRLFLLLLVLMLTLAGCSSSDEGNDIVEDDQRIEAEQDNPEITPAEQENTDEESTGDGVIDHGDHTHDIAIGKPAPAFTLKNLAGDEVSLSDYQGKYVLINFWATWCGYCDLEMPDLQIFNDEHEDIVVLAIDVNEKKEDVEDYITKGGYTFDVVLDTTGTVSHNYLVSGLPTSYFVDPDGILLGGIPGMLTLERMNELFEMVKGQNQ